MSPSGGERPTRALSRESDEVVAMADELRDEPRAPGAIARLLGPESGGRRAVTAFVAGIGATAVFVASLLTDWQRVSMPGQRNYGIEEGEFNVGLDAAPLGMVYPIGVLGLLTVLGLALTRAEAARRLRPGAVMLGVGIVGVLVAIMDQLRDVLMLQFFGYRFAVPGAVPEELREVFDGTRYAPQPGQLLAFGAVALLVVAVWLAGGPLRTAPGTGTPDVLVAPAEPSASVTSTGSAAPVAPAGAEAAGAPVGPPGLPLERPSSKARSSTRPVGYVDGLTVTASDAIDPGSQADFLRS